MIGRAAYTWPHVWDPPSGDRDPVRRFEPGNDRAELHYEDLLAAGEWTGARVGQRREGQLEFLVIIILVRSEEGLKLWQWRGGERKETKNIKMHKREEVPWLALRLSSILVGGSHTHLARSH